MQAKELCNIFLSPLVTTTFCVQWSTDDNISVITEKGIHVFELAPTPTCPNPTFAFSRSFIHPSEILPTQSFEEEIDIALWKFERQELYLFLMEEALTPIVDGTKEPEPRITGLAWSPRGLFNPCRSLLVTVTSYGAVDILFKVSTNWYSACDLSTLWLNEIYGISGKDIKDKIKEAPSIEVRKYLRRLQATAVTWSELHELGNKRFAYLVTAFRNSEIVIWRVPEISDKSNEWKPSVAFKIVLECESKLNVLKWIKLDKRSIIVMGYVDGRVNALLLDVIDDKFKNPVFNKYWTDVDRIPVNSIELWENTEYGPLIVICKGAFLCILRPSHNGTIKDAQCIQVEGFSVTGVVITNGQQLMVTTQDGGLFSLSFKNGQLVYYRMKHNLPSSNVQYLGVANSQNKVLFLNLTSPNVMHDHLINREPSTLCIFALEGQEWNPLEVLKKNKSETLTRHWDCLESIRVQILRFEDSSNMLPCVQENLDKLSNYELRLAMWNSVIAEALEKKKFPRRNTSITGEVSEAHSLIFLRLATARLVELSSNTNLTTTQRNCCSLLRSYIEVYLAGEEEEVETKSVKDAREALISTNHLNSVKPESCDICGEIITELSWKTTSCPSGHKLPRCAITLLQISAINYRTCPICGQILHPCLDEEYEEPLCPYCQVPAMYDSRVLDIKSKYGLPIKNLSKRRIAATQQSKTQEMD